MADEVKDEMQINAWRISAKADTRFELQDSDEDFMFAAIKPGDAMLLLDETGDKAWGIRRVFLVRRVTNGSIVYFDREFQVGFQDVPFVGEGSKTVLRQIDLQLIDEVLANETPPGKTDPCGDPAEDNRELLSFASICAMELDGNETNRVYVRKLLKTIVTDDLLGPAQGPDEEIVGMSVRDRYILGRLGPRKRDDLTHYTGSRWRSRPLWYTIRPIDIKCKLEWRC